MAIYYKFKDAKGYDTIAMDGPFISVGVLVAKILEIKHLGSCEDIDFVVSNAQTNEEYRDEAMLIAENTYVLIRLVPGRPRITVTTAQEPRIENKVENVHVADPSAEAFRCLVDKIPSSERRFYTGVVKPTKFVSNLRRGSIRRRLDFEVPGKQKKDIAGDQQTVCDNKVESSSRCVLPSISLHLNPSTTPIHSQETMQETWDQAASEPEEGQAVEEAPQAVEEAPQAVEVTPGSLREKMRMLFKPCNCKKSKCLKLYCECFAASVYCLEPCTCVDCANKPIYENTVMATRKRIEKRNSLAFALKVIPSADSIMEAGDDASKTPASARHKRGCNCKKSNCLKKYCECFQGEVGCSIQCSCEGCKNKFGRNDESKKKKGHRVPGTDLADPDYMMQMGNSMQPSLHRDLAESGNHINVTMSRDEVKSEPAEGEKMKMCRYGESNSRMMIMKDGAAASASSINPNKYRYGPQLPDPSHVRCERPESLSPDHRPPCQINSLSRDSKRYPERYPDERYRHQDVDGEYEHRTRDEDRSRDQHRYSERNQHDHRNRKRSESPPSSEPPAATKSEVDNSYISSVFAWKSLPKKETPSEEDMRLVDSWFSSNEETDENQKKDEEKEEERWRRII